MNTSTPVLQIQSLTTAYRFNETWLPAVRDVSLDILPGQVYGLVGESGSGKTTLAMTVMRYLGKDGKAFQGQVIFQGKDLLTMSEQEMGALWGRSIALVPQNSLSVLNPTLTMGSQLAEIFQRHQPDRKDVIKSRVLDSLTSVHLEDPIRVAESYPHQLSGGMQQRVLIAMATCLKPQLLILDEPTSNLDVTTQASILQLLADLVRGAPGALYISHDLGVISQVCDQVGVLYAGELVETASTDTLFNQSLHPYTLGLLASMPRLGESKKEQPLQAMPGSIPPITGRSQGCSFASRCPLVIDACSEHPLLETAAPGHQVRCHRWKDIDDSSIKPWRQPKTPIRAADDEEVSQERTLEQVENVLDVKNVHIHFDLPRSSYTTSNLGWSTQKVNQAEGSALQLEVVHNATFAIRRGMTYGLVGESGSGKTSLARAIAGLVEVSSGEMELLQAPLPAKLSQRAINILRNLQMVFQNPDDILNPYRTIGDSLSRPYIRLQGHNTRQAKQEVGKLLEMVHMPRSYAERMPDQLSGGERQRLAIARAFALNPALLLADEPVSALDVSVQAAILNLLSDLQEDQGTAMLFISHDLAVVSYIADRIAVIFRGIIVETTSPLNLTDAPHHPYTLSLLEATPELGSRTKAHKDLTEVGSGKADQNRPRGCRYYTRCPVRIEETCRDQPPPWRETARGTHILCHLELEKLDSLQRSPLPTNGPDQILEMRNRS